MDRAAVEQRRTALLVGLAELHDVIAERKAALEEAERAELTQRAAIDECEHWLKVLAGKEATDASH